MQKKKVGTYERCPRRKEKINQKETIKNEKRKRKEKGDEC